GSYPAALAQLVPQYVVSPERLRPASKPNGPEFTYHRPGADATSTFVVLEYSVPIEFVKREPARFQMQLNGQLMVVGKNGRRQPVNTRQYRSGPDGRSPGPGFKIDTGGD